MIKRKQVKTGMVKYSYILQFYIVGYNLQVAIFDKLSVSIQVVFWYLNIPHFSLIFPWNHFQWRIQDFP